MREIRPRQWRFADIFLLILRARVRARCGNNAARAPADEKGETQMWLRLALVLVAPVLAALYEYEDGGTTFEWLHGILSGTWEFLAVYI